MNRSIGLPDSYPYQLPPDVVTKMAGVHELLAAAISAESAAESAADAGVGADVGADAEVAAEVAAGVSLAPADTDPRLPVLQAGGQSADRVLDAPGLQ